ncbi:hypothetical protein [uncultured Maribacter sp.]|uniref:hypothetical protein n=1 Tax=uncultured Maribacter sp. TaxID=431308 RepID=UPI00260528E6|nr:hypothetical protein [uncultured Maribacter sp.]
MNKHSLLYIIKLIILVVSVVYTLDKVVYFGLETLNKNVYTGASGGKVNQFLREKDNLDFIVLGSSRANHHVDNIKISKNSFNMGLDGTKIAFSATLLKTLPTNKAQIILLHISPKHSLDSNYKGDDIEGLSKLYHQNNIIKEEYNALGKNKIMNQIFWSLNFNGTVMGLFKNYFFPNYDINTYSGYDPLYITDEQKRIFKTVLENKINEPCLNEPKLNSIYERYLDEISLFCKENNKKLILFTAPIYQDDCKNDDDILGKILKQKNIEYWNMTSFFNENNSLNYWRDNSHLSNTGAEIFTDSLKLKLNQLK